MKEKRLQSKTVERGVKCSSRKELEKIILKKKVKGRAERDCGERT